MSDTTVHKLLINNARVAEANFGVTAGRSSTSVSTVAWSVVDGDVTISNESTSSNVSTALITAPASCGCALVLAFATMANGEKVSEYFEFKITEPKCSGSQGSY